MPKLVDAAQRREELAEAAARVIARSGIDGASLREVAAEAGWTTGALVHYFASKRDLLAFTLQASLDRRRSRHADRAELPPGHALRSMLVEALPTTSETTLHWIVTLAFAGQASSDPALASIQREAYHDFRSAVIELVASDAGAEPAREAERLIALVDGIALQALFDPELWTEQRQVAALDAGLGAAMTTLSADHLVLSHFSLARDHPLDDRIRAAGTAGFDGIGFYAGQFPTLGDDWSAGRIHELLDAARIEMSELEALSGWGAGRPSERYLDFERLVWELVDEFNVPYVQAIGPVEGSTVEAGRRFGELCDRAAEHGTTVGLEFLPFTNIVDAADALALVEAAGRPNGGVCADIWHHARGAGDLELIRRIPPELLVRVQMSDGPIAPTLDDYKDDCVRYRVPPGTGEFDVDGFVDVVLDAGYDGPWDLEVCNDDVWNVPVDEHVRRSADGMRRVLERVRTHRSESEPR